MALIENKKQVIIFILAVGTGLVAAFLVSIFVQSSITKQTEALAGKFKKEQKATDEAYKKQMKELNDKIMLVEQSARKAGQDAAQMVASQQMNKVQEVKQEKKAISLALRTPVGKRAMTFLIDMLQAVGGMVGPGDYVDIIAQLNVPAGGKSGDKKNSVTAMIVQNLQILAINTSLDLPAKEADIQRGGPMKITFAVTPEEASLLAFAEKNGKLELTLRSPNEKKPAMVSAATWSTLAEYVLQNTGADLNVSTSSAAPAPMVTDEPIDVNKAGYKRRDLGVDPAIEVYKSGRGAN